MFIFKTIATDERFYYLRSITEKDLYTKDRNELLKVLNIVAGKHYIKDVRLLNYILQYEQLPFSISQKRVLAPDGKMRKVWRVRQYLTHAELGITEEEVLQGKA